MSAQIKINIYLMIKIDISAPLDPFLVLVLHHRLEDRGGGSEDHLVYVGKGEKKLRLQKIIYRVDTNLMTLHRLSVEDKGEVAPLHFVEHILPNFPATLILSFS